jgi:hypothetical protein
MLAAYGLRAIDGNLDFVARFSPLAGLWIDIVKAGLVLDHTHGMICCPPIWQLNEIITLPHSVMSATLNDRALWWSTFPDRSWRKIRFSRKTRNGNHGEHSD